jgi:hypothetical protein
LGALAGFAAWMGVLAAYIAILKLTEFFRQRR